VADNLHSWFDGTIHAVEFTTPEIDAGVSTTRETVVTGEIRNSFGDVSVDHWALSHEGGALTVDALAMGFEGGSLDSMITLYRDNGDGTFTNIAYNDDGAAGADGSTSGMDSYISVADLAAGDYFVAVSAYPFDSSEALNTGDAFPNAGGGSIGPYQLTITGASTVSGIMANPVGGAPWGDPMGDAVIVSETEAGGGETLVGTAADETLIGGAQGDEIAGGGGADLLEGWGGDDLIYGGVTGPGDTLSGGLGDDTLLAGVGADTLDGGLGDDRLEGDATYVDPAQHASTDDGGAVTLTITNSAAAVIETWWIDHSGNLVDFGPIQPGETINQGTFIGHNWVLRDEDGATLQLIEADGNLTVDYGAESLDDSLSGGDGADTLLGQFGLDTLEGGAGDDVLDGGVEHDTLAGGAGDDSIMGGQGDDLLVGDDGLIQLVADETYDAGSTGWTFVSGGAAVATNESLAGDPFLGRFEGSATGDEHIRKTFDLADDAPNAVIEFDFLKIDSWDENQDETFTVYIDQTAAFTFQPWGVYWGEEGADASGTFFGGSWEVTSSGADADLGFGTGNNFDDRAYHVRIELDTPGDTVDVGVGALLGDGLADESWGLDNVKVASTDYAEYDFDAAAGAGADTLEGGAGNDVAFGGDGDDLIIWTLGDGNDTIDGGSGGGWIDTLELGGVVVNEATVGSWMSFDTGGIDSATLGEIVLTADSSGTIAASDGSEIAFAGLERVTW
jgi:Ca2+-binding RTX toxin-like protein